MILKIILKALKPFRLISLVTTYVLGAGLVQYIREMRNWTVFFQGGVFLVLFIIGIELLRILQTLQDVKKWPEGMMLEEAKRARLALALICAVFMTLATTLFIGWMVNGILWQGLTFLIIGLTATGGLYFLARALKDLRPFTILIEAVLFVVIPPAMAYFLQSQDLHRLLTLVVIGLVPAYMSYRVLAGLKWFSRDQKYRNITIVTYLGWPKAMVLHNALILLTYLIFALIAILGFPWFLLWPVFLTLPIGLLEIWLMERVKRGGKPQWPVMQFATASVLLLPIYLIGFAFWIR